MAKTRKFEGGGEVKVIRTRSPRKQDLSSPLEVLDHEQALANVVEEHPQVEGRLASRPWGHGAWSTDQAKGCR
jgi:hypothetical protein